MVKETFGNIKDDDTRTSFEFLQEALQQKDLPELSAAPTTTEPLLEANEAGWYGDKMYKRIAGTVYEFTPSDTIVVA